jgi:hypothetical protein
VTHRRPPTISPGAKGTLAIAFRSAAGVTVERQKPAVQRRQHSLHDFSPLPSRLIRSRHVPLGRPVKPSIISVGARPATNTVNLRFHTRWDRGAGIKTALNPRVAHQGGVKRTRVQRKCGQVVRRAMTIHSTVHIIFSTRPPLVISTRKTRFIESFTRFLRRPLGIQRCLDAVAARIAPGVARSSAMVCAAWNSGG